MEKINKDWVELKKLNFYIILFISVYVIISIVIDLIIYKLEPIKPNLPVLLWLVLPVIIIIFFFLLLIKRSLSIAFGGYLLLYTYIFFLSMWAPIKITLKILLWMVFAALITAILFLWILYLWVFHIKKEMIFNIEEV